MYYVLITDNDGNENRLKARTWDEVLLFVRVHRGKIKEFKFKRKQEDTMMLPELRDFLMYEVTTIEKIKRKRFYRNYILRRKK